MPSPLLVTRHPSHPAAAAHRPRDANRVPVAHRALVAVLAGLLVLLVGPPIARAQTSVEVRITSRLEPTSVTVTPGTTVTWVNADGERHRMRSQDGPEEFDSGNLEPGQRFSHTFRAQGTTTYVDDRDDDDTAYHGKVVVASDAAPDTEPEPDPAGPSGPETHAVSMAGRRFAPATLEITTGDTVRFINDDDREHTATADDRSFDSGILRAGQEFERTFTRAGTYSYLCLVHPDMTGRVAVADPGGTAPPPKPAPDPDPDPAPPPSPSSPRPQGSSDGGAPAPQRVTVQMRDFSFAPAALELPAGSTIVFENVGRATHTATATDGSFDSDLVSSGGSYERRFAQPGTFAYTCLLHPQMVGEVVITAGSGRAAAGEEAATARLDAPTERPDTIEDATATGASDATGTSADPSVPAVVSITDNAFLPDVLEVSVDQEVVWTNDGEAVHTVTADDGAFDSGLVAAGETFSMRFEEPGTVAYLCSVHPGMTAEVRVLALTDDASGLATATAATDGSGRGLSVVALELLMLGAFAVALAGFTVLSRRFAALDAGADA